MPDSANLPQFKYHPNLYKLGIFEEFHGTCECCGKEGDLFYQVMYTSEDVDYICLDCIASCRVAQKFGGTFSAACTAAPTSWLWRRAERFDHAVWSQ